MDNYDNFPEEWKKQGAESRLWSHDWAVEVYIDTFGDGRASAAKGYGDDDYRYDFAPPLDNAKTRRRAKLRNCFGDNRPTRRIRRVRPPILRPLSCEGGGYLKHTKPSHTRFRALACKVRMRPDHGSSPNMETVYP